MCYGARTTLILGNLKIVTTGVLFRVILKRQLNKLQWIALALLMVGATTSQIGCTGSGLSAPVQGYMLGMLSACLSALAGVYTEKLMKMNDDNLYWQNLQLYSFGVVFNAARQGHTAGDRADRGRVSGSRGRAARAHVHTFITCTRVHSPAA